MIIGNMIILYFFSLLSWICWDSYMKLKNKPLVENKLVRFMFVHCGSYNDNEIRVGVGRLQLPDVKNRDSISKTIMMAQISCFIYAVIVIVLDAVCLATKNNTFYCVTVPLFSIYFIFTVVMLILGGKKYVKEYKQQSIKKYEVLVKLGQKNSFSVEDVADYLQNGYKINFELYGLLFEFSIYKEDKDKGKILQLLDLTHGRILNVNKDLNEIVDNTFINDRSIKDLWIYLDMSVSDGVNQI